LAKLADFWNFRKIGNLEKLGFFYTGDMEGDVDPY
jgi:hypothetical protein